MNGKLPERLELDYERLNVGTVGDGSSDAVGSIIHQGWIVAELQPLASGGTPSDDSELFAALVHRYNAHAQLERDRAELVEALAKARHLVRLVTVRQAVTGGDKALEASGLHPYCMNEGRATGDEKLSTWEIDALLERMGKP